ncbi:hypothetical protein DMP23_47035 [Amycolatopsis sp. A1MSW2902]
MLGTALAAPAAAADAGSGGARHCVEVVQKKLPGETASRVLSRTCADSAAKLVRPLDDPLIITFWEDAGYEGDHVEAYGDSGPCDAAGYGFNDMSDILDGGTSSYKLAGGCTVAEYFSDTYLEGSFSGLIYGDQSIVTGGWNDNIGSMSIHAG